MTWLPIESSHGSALAVDLYETLTEALSDPDVPIVRTIASAVIAAAEEASNWESARWSPAARVTLYEGLAATLQAAARAERDGGGDRLADMLLTQVDVIARHRQAGECPACGFSLEISHAPSTLVPGYHDHCVTPKDDRAAEPSYCVDCGFELTADDIAYTEGDGDCRRCRDDDIHRSFMKETR